MDTIPIEDLVQQTKSFAIKYGTDLVLVEIAALTGPISGFFAPLINYFFRSAVGWVVARLVNKSDRFLFGINMDLVTSDQAKDYRASIAKLIKAPDEISDADWEKLEDEANHNFGNLVRLGA